MVLMPLGSSALYCYHTVSKCFKKSNISKCNTVVSLKELCYQFPYRPHIKNCYNIPVTVSLGIHEASNINLLMIKPVGGKTQVGPSFHSRMPVFSKRLCCLGESCEKHFTLQLYFASQEEITSWKLDIKNNYIAKK